MLSVIVHRVFHPRCNKICDINNRYLTVPIGKSAVTRQMEEMQKYEVGGKRGHDLVDRTSHAQHL